MLIVGLNGSPRRGGNTATLLKAVLAAAEARDARTEIIQVSDALKNLKIPFCYQCTDPCRGLCSRGNHLGECLDLLRESDAVVLASPVYFGTVSAQLKAFWDKTRILRREMALLNAVGAAVAVGSSRFGGQEAALTAMYHMMLVQGMTLVGDGYQEDDCGHLGAAAQAPATADVEAFKRAGVLGRRLAQVALATRGLRGQARAAALGSELGSALAEGGAG